MFLTFQYHNTHFITTMEKEDPPLYFNRSLPLNWCFMYLSTKNGNLPFSTTDPLCLLKIYDTNLLFVYTFTEKTWVLRLISSNLIYPDT